MNKTCRNCDQALGDQRITSRSQFVLFGFMNNILSGTKYRDSPVGVSFRDETSNLASHLERSPLIHSDYYESAGDRPSCLTSLSLKSKSFMQYAGT